ncbi:hypothetical protein DERP_001628 [Dermatophagoides pteronyssinus]|uniref:Uncharacterized protein n=1 Tax=Dermatophagoides pteronyssinus TaxID=6956 RepID=A0ABQ8JB15_DERPT|nr:hypothetical protein DERP_001628 [Dermatophagoides pteronyssinus]
MKPTIPLNSGILIFLVLVFVLLTIHLLLAFSRFPCEEDEMSDVIPPRPARFRNYKSDTFKDNNN